MRIFVRTVLPGYRNAAYRGVLYCAFSLLGLAIAYTSNPVFPTELLGLGIILAALYLQGRVERERVFPMGTGGTVSQERPRSQRNIARGRVDISMLQRPRGTRDFLPAEMEQRRIVENSMRRTAQSWGYREICTPTFEELELFTLRSGEGILDEMYVFEDKGGRKLALRPEVTASVQRFYVNVGKTLPKPLRWFYFADCFRYERPQKGRYRQFWQFGVELIGQDTPSQRPRLSCSQTACSLRVGSLSPST